MADPIGSAATAFPAFIGYTEKAPATGEPVWIASLAQYRAAFGDSGPEGFRLDAAIRAFYANGGDDALVLSAGLFDVGTPPDPVPLLDALERIASDDRPTLLLIPDALRLTRSDYHVLVRAMLAQCAALGDRFAILDLHGGDDPASWSVAGSAPLIADFRAAVLEQPARSYGAAYHPWLRAADGSVAPPSGAVAGLYARADREQGVWKAPANIGPAGFADATVHYREADLADLNAPANGVAIDAIRFFNELGLRVWGARTLDGNDNNYRYVPVRRTLIWLWTSLKRGLAPLGFEPDSPALRVDAKALAETFLTGAWRQGALQGVKPEEAFYVRCDDSVMTPGDLEHGRLIVEVGVAPLHPAEFVIFRIALN